MSFKLTEVLMNFQADFQFDLIDSRHHGSTAIKYCNEDRMTKNLVIQKFQELLPGIKIIEARQMPNAMFPGFRIEIDFKEGETV